MAQTIALQTRVPSPDFGQAMSTAQDLVRGEQDIQRNNQLLERGKLQNLSDRVKFDEQSMESTALANFRKNMGAGDKTGAMKALDAYPMLQAQMHKAFQDMKPDQIAEAKKVANEFYKSYTYIQRFMPGTPERSVAWNKEIDRLQEGGYIDDATAATWKKAGPSDLILEQARMVAAAADSYNPPGKQGLSPNEEAFEERMLEWDKQNTPKKGDFSGPPGEDEWRRYDARRKVFEAQMRRRYDISQDYGRGGQHYELGESPADQTPQATKANLEPSLETGGVPDNQSGVSIPDANSAAGNANQVDLGTEAKPKQPKNAAELKANVKIGEYYVHPQTGDVYRRVR